MRGWRIKFIFLLIVYFAGFATAIYTLAPAPDNLGGQRGETGILNSEVKMSSFAQSLNSGMHKAIDVGKEAAWRTAKFLKKKIEGKQPQSNS